MNMFNQSEKTVGSQVNVSGHSQEVDKKSLSDAYELMKNTEIDEQATEKYNDEITDLLVAIHMAVVTDQPALAKRAAQTIFMLGYQWSR